MANRFGLRARAASISRELVGFGGVAAVTYGVSCIYSPLGWIVGGAFAIAWALIDGRIGD